MSDGPKPKRGPRPEVFKVEVPCEAAVKIALKTPPPEKQPKRRTKRKD